MARVGLNVSADGRNDPALVRALGATFVRVVALPDVDQLGYLEACKSAGLDVLLTFARESGGEYDWYRAKYGDLVDWVQAGNEPDIDSPSSWTMPQRAFERLGRRVREAWPDRPVIAGGLASGQPAWLAGVDLSWADAVAFHPYLKDATPGNDLPEIGDLLSAYAVYGKPLVISEWGWWGDEERGAPEVGDATTWAALAQDVGLFAYFCLDDLMVPPFGLLRADGSYKPAAGRFATAARSAVPSPWPPPTTPERDMTTTLPLGVDVSNHQRAVDWPAVARSGVEFAVVKATEGTDYTDPYVWNNWASVKLAGLHRGSYHFALPQRNAAADEVDHYLDVTSRLGLAEGDLLAVDVEEHPVYGPLPGHTAAWVAEFVQRVRDRVGFWPLVYTRRDIAERYGFRDREVLGNCGLWVAAYGSVMPAPFEPWSVVAFWQYSASGSVPGVDGDCDLDRFNGSADRIPLYGKPTDVSAPVPDPSTFEYKLGFKELADHLGRGVVGDPLEDEHGDERSGHRVSHQLTTRGEMVWWVTQGVGHFYPMAR